MRSRVAIVGAGFGGIGASVALDRAGVEHVVLERADELGGTWRDNRYPGCRCDVPSHLYSFSFAPNSEWTETYSTQWEIQEYLRRTAKDFGVVDRTLFGHEVLDAAWDDEHRRWRITTSQGERTADFVVFANGPLAEPRYPDTPGLDTFEGDAFHSARWPDDVDLAGKRVAVVGTGASAIQIVPSLQPIAEHIVVFQRTAPWVVPHRNRRITGFERGVYRRFPAAQRFVRGYTYWLRELLFAPALLKNDKGLDRLERMIRRSVEKQVRDPELLAKLLPDYRPGCKRLLPSNDWYPAIQQPNVDLVTEKILEIRPNAIVTVDGSEIPVDAIVLATGFHVTDNPVLGRVRGRDGRSLLEHWSGTGMRAYLGTTVPEFPNMFLLAGPNTGIGHTSLVYMIEAQLAYVADAITRMRARGVASFDVREDVAEHFNEEVQRKAAHTVWNTGGCASWYLDAEGRNTTLWPDQSYRFRRRTRRFDPRSYSFKR